MITNLFNSGSGEGKGISVDTALGSRTMTWEMEEERLK